MEKNSLEPDTFAQEKLPNQVFSSIWREHFVGLGGKSWAPPVFLPPFLPSQTVEMGGFLPPFCSSFLSKHRLGFKFFKICAGLGVGAFVSLYGITLH
jgi:hypothetical protein